MQKINVGGSERERSDGRQEGRSCIINSDPDFAYFVKEFTEECDGGYFLSVFKIV